MTWAGESYVVALRSSDNIPPVVGEGVSVTNGAPQLHSFFFAAVPPAEVADEFAAAWRDYGTGDRFRADKLHMTLHYALRCAIADEASDDRSVRSLLGAGEGLRAAPFTLVFDRITTFGRERQPALAFAADDSAGRAHDVLTKLRSATIEAGIAPRSNAPQQAAPHVTAAYGHHRGFERPLPNPIRWTITEFELIDSLVGQSRYLHLGRWRLHT